MVPRFIKAGVELKLKPTKTIRFTERIEVQGVCDWSIPTCPIVVLTTDKLIPGYLGNSEEERQVLYKFRTPDLMDEDDASLPVELSTESTPGSPVGQFTRRLCCMNYDASRRRLDIITDDATLTGQES